MQCTERPARIEVHQRANGLAECYIRRNIHEIETGDGETAFECDQVMFTGDYTQAYIEAHEEELWRKFDPTPVSERIATAEGITAEHDDAIIELYEMMIGE